MKRLIVLMVGAGILSGCAKLAHLEQLLTLKSFSEEQEAIQRHVEEHDKKFERMLDAVKAGDLKAYPDQKSIVAAFGNPVYKKMTRQADEEEEMWLYRQAKARPDSEKVYLYFDGSGHLREWRHVLPKNS